MAKQIELMSISYIFDGAKVEFTEYRQGSKSWENYWNYSVVVGGKVLEERNGLYIPEGLGLGSVKFLLAQIVKP